MKLVREHIFEKFSEESDPIADMGIGLQAVYDNLKIGDIVQVKIDFDPRSFPKKGSYLLITNVTPASNYDAEDDITKRIYQKTFLTKEDIINNDDVYSDTQNWGWSFGFFKEAFKYIGTIETLKRSVNKNNE